MSTNNALALANELQGEPKVIYASLLAKLIPLGINDLPKKMDALIFNEENIPQMQAFRDEAAKIRIEHGKIFKEAKAPILQRSKDFDLVNKVFAEQFSYYEDGVQKELNRLAKIKADREAAEERDKKERAERFESIKSKRISFAKEISETDSFEAIRKIEDRINLAKGNAPRLGEEFSKLFIEELTGLTSVISSQKEIIKKKVALDAELEAAKKAGDEEATSKLMDERADAIHQLEDNKQKVIEEAVKTAEPTVYDAQPIIATTRTKRKAWAFEPIDTEWKDVVKVINDHTKKVNTEWLTITPNSVAIKAYMASNKEAWEREGITEKIVHGIKFFLEVTY